ncbi:MAG: tetratricopeptide repeat protein [Chloroflexota bacterium]
MRKLHLLYLTMLLTGACTLAAGEPQVVIVTSDAPPAERTQIAAQITAQPLTPEQATVVPATPVPTQPPTPTVPPDLLLQQGDRLRLNGYYELAIETYSRVLDGGDTVPADSRAEALFRQGQSAVREGLFGDAVAPLTDLILNFPDDGRVPQAYFLRGDAYLGQSQWQAAIDDFTQYVALRPGFVDSYAYERIGDAQLALGERESAIQSYTQAVQASRSLVPLLALRERLAQIYIGAGQVESAVAEYDAILLVAENPGYRADIEYRAGQALLAAGDTEAGLARMRRVFDTYPVTVFAYNAMIELDRAQIDLSEYDRGVVSYNYGDYEGAIEAFNNHTTEVLLSTVPGDMYLLLGRAYREVGNPTAANVAFSTLIEQYPQDPAFGDALLEQGRTLFLDGDWQGAAARYLNIAENFGYLNESAAKAQWRAAYLYGTNDEAEQSYQLFEQLAERFPESEQARSGLLLGASTAYSSGNYATAERLYARLSSVTTGEDQATAFFWLGQIALQQGNIDRANQAFQSAVNADPDSYFAARARDLVSGVGAFQPPAQYRFQFDEAAELVQAEDWLRQVTGTTQEGVLWPLSPELQADPRLQRGQELWQLAAYDEAEVEFFDVINEKRDNGDMLASYQLAVHLRSMGAYYTSIFAAANVIRQSGETTLSAPPFIARMRYPAYYLDVVQEVAERRNIDPLLIFSLIRHESLFNTNATAAAGEKGLTQVIPGTGAYIAEQIAWEDYQHSDLFRPYAGVEFGGYYLQEQLELFDYNVPAALSAYNAGPGRAIDWLALSGGDPDLFITTITIDSTRLYVQLIYRNHSIYRALYGTG